MMIIWRRGWIGGAVAVLVLLPILLSGCGAGAPARGGAALPHLEATLRLVPLNTGASGGQVALSPRWRRAVVLVGGTLSLVDLDHARVLGALATGRTAMAGSGGRRGRPSWPWMSGAAALTWSARARPVRGRTC